MKYVYPAVFHAEPEGGYTISFPDIEGCLSQGETIQECCIDALGYGRKSHFSTVSDANQ